MGASVGSVLRKKYEKHPGFFPKMSQKKYDFGVKYIAPASLSKPNPLRSRNLCDLVSSPMIRNMFGHHGLGDPFTR